MKKVLARMMLLCLAFLALAKKAFAGDLSATSTDFGIATGYVTSGLAPTPIYPIAYGLRVLVLFPLLALSVISMLVFTSKKLVGRDAWIPGATLLIGLGGLLALYAVTGVTFPLVVNLFENSEIANYSSLLLIAVLFVPVILVYVACIYLIIRLVKTRREKIKKALAAQKVAEVAEAPKAPTVPTKEPDPKL
jgi:cytochrome bd-type quinol oxidase subunit 2